MRNLILSSVLFMFLFGSVQAKVPTDKDIVCMTNAIYFEARGESEMGRLAVGFVVRNRMIQNKKTACEVVYEKNQFVWTKTIPVITNHEVWMDLYQMSIMILMDEYLDPTSGAVFFHEKSLDPYWNDSLVKVLEEGNHVFYRFPYPYNTL